MGPGFHADIEKNFFEAKFPEVEFWSQPVANSFSDLVNLCENKMLEMQKAIGKPIKLIAHSFGGQLAWAIGERHPEKINTMIFLNSAFSPFECFINLGRHLKLVDENRAKFLRLATVEDKINFVFEISMQPQFSQLYWHSETRFTEYNSKAQHFASLNPDVFVQIFSDYLAKKINAPISPSKFTGKVQIYSSVFDRLLSEDDTLKWRHIYPKAQLHSLNLGGHYALFEDPSLAERILKS